MSVSDASVVSGVIAAYEAATINVELTLAVTAILLYDVILTLDKEIQYVWQSPRSWHQRALYILSRHALPVSNVLILGTLNPISNRSCAAMDWTIRVASFLSTLGPPVFTVMRTYALLSMPLDSKSASRRNMALGVVMLLTSTTTIVYDGIFSFWQTLVNLPAPDNCSAVSGMSDSLSTSLEILAIVCSAVGLILAAAVTWRRTWQAWRRQARNELSSRRKSLYNVMFEYGMMYFCTLLSLNVADSTLELLSLAGSSISSPTSYVGYFADLLSAVLTGRFMLDIWETKAKIERGGATNSGSFSVDLNGANGDGLTGHSDGFIGTLEFTHSYGGLARSCLDHEDYEDGDEDVQSEIVDANASANVEEARFDWTGAGDAQSEITGGSGRFDERLLV